MVSPFVFKLILLRAERTLAAERSERAWNLNSAWRASENSSNTSSLSGSEPKEDDEEDEDAEDAEDEEDDEDFFRPLLGDWDNEELPHVKLTHSTAYDAPIR